MEHPTEEKEEKKQTETANQPKIERNRLRNVDRKDAQLYPNEPKGG